ncbi:hypothetical protein AB688_18440 [Pseudomonas putida]|uniref:hypothetical protein n=1 Tax=Pseudomonas putida TaxID=303 RepID=UPI0007B6DDBF|nr:hypothetical protein [Pseudomonas putida]ANC03984.1 hypothetical protein AB688_18440 [Pseudomonas putida]
MREYQPQTRAPRGVDPQVRVMSVICDVCGTPRNKGKHDKCSKARQAAGFRTWAERPASTPVTCAECGQVHRLDAMMGNTCRRCYAETMYRVIAGEAE